MDGLEIGILRTAEGGFGKARRGRREAEHAEDRSRLDSPKLRVAAGDVVGCHASLAVRRACERENHRLASQDVFRLHGVAHRPNPRIARAHAGIHLDPAGGADFQTCFAGEGGFGPNSERQNHQVAIECRTGFDEDLGSAVFPRSKSCDRLAEEELASAFLESLADQHGHLGIEIREDFLLHFHQRDAQAAMEEVFGHFDADVAPADYDGRGRAARGDPFADAVGIRNRANRENSRKINARQRGTDRRGTGRKNQRVVRK